MPVFNDTKILGDLKVTGKAKGKFPTEKDDFSTKEYADIINDIISDTYTNIKSLATNNELIAGKWYEINNFSTTTNGESDSSSDGTIYKIVIPAISSSEFGSQGYVSGLVSGVQNQNIGDIIYYSIDNKWWSNNSGKGIIWRYIDKNNNDLPYDFKSIKFSWSSNELENTDISSGTYYTFEYNGDSSNGGFVFNNKIARQRMSATSYFNLSKNLFYGNNFYNNTIGNGFYNNTIGNNFRNNTIGNYFYRNTIGNNFYYNTIGNNFYYNVVDNNVQYISLATDGTFQNKIQNLYLKNSLIGTSNTNKLSLYFDGLYGRDYNTTFEIIGNGNIVATWQDSPLSFTGKVKATKTTSSWSDI